MSNNKEWYEEEDDFETEDDFSDSGLTNLRKADRAKSKRIKELEGELESLRKFQRESTVSSVLNERGVNPKVAAFIPESVATDAESISNWLNEHGEIFGVQSQSVQESRSINEEDLGVMRQIDSATSNALSPDDVNDAYSRLSNAQSIEEIMMMIQGTE